MISFLVHVHGLGGTGGFEILDTGGRLKLSSGAISYSGTLILFKYSTVFYKGYYENLSAGASPSRTLLLSCCQASPG